MSSEYKFKIKEGKEADYEILKANNSDYFGSTIMLLAERWGNMMEERIKYGSTVADAAESTRVDADIWNTSGSMLGFAKEVLATFWKHGDEFLQWNDNNFNCNSNPEEEPIEQSDENIEMKGY